MYSFRLCITVLAALFSFLYCGLSLAQGQPPTLSLSDFDWEVTGVASVTSIERKTMSTSLTRGPIVDTLADSEELSIVTVRLTATQAGRVRLAPELFFAGGLFFDLCQGLRVVEPTVGIANPELFDSPDGSVLTLTVSVRQAVVLELAFAGSLGGNTQLFAAVPMTRLSAGRSP